MNRTLALLLLAVAAAFAEGPPSDRKMVEVKHLRGPRFDQAVRLLADYLAPGDAKPYPELNAVLLRGTQQSIAMAEDLLKKFDVPAAATQSRPPEAYQIRIYMVRAGTEGSGGPIPQEIAPAIEQMKKTFLYKNYRVLETVLIQAGRGGVQVTGLVPDPDLPDATYTAKIRDIAQVDDGKSLLLRGFWFLIRRPMRPGAEKQTIADASIETELTIRPGQKLVIGKLTVSQSDNPVFLVITADPV